MDKFFWHRQILKFLNFKISPFELASQILYFVNACKILRREILAANFKILQNRILLGKFYSKKFYRRARGGENWCGRGHAKAKLGRERKHL